MVFVPVGQHDAEQFVLDGADRSKVRNNNVHAQMGIVRKHEAAVDHHHAARCFPQLAVEADFS